METPTTTPDPQGRPFEGVGFFAITKAHEEQGEDGKKLYLSGPITSANPDYDGEIPQGIEDALKVYEKLGGWVDYEHLYKKSLQEGKPDPDLLIGRKHLISKGPDGTPWMVTELDADNPIAQKVYRKVKKGWRFGYSIDGIALKNQKDPNRPVVKEVHLITVAPMPRNFDVFLKPGIVLKALVDAGDAGPAAEKSGPEVEDLVAQAVAALEDEGSTEEREVLEFSKSLDLLSRNFAPGEFFKAFSAAQSSLAPGVSPSGAELGGRSPRAVVAAAAQEAFDKARERHNHLWKQAGGFSGGEKADYHRGVVMGMGTHLIQMEPHHGETHDLLDRSARHLDNVRYMGDRATSNHYEQGFYHGANLIHDAVTRAAAKVLPKEEAPAKKAVVAGSGVVEAGATGGPALRKQDLLGDGKRLKKKKGKKRMALPTSTYGAEMAKAVGIVKALTHDQIIEHTNKLALPENLAVPHRASLMAANLHPMGEEHKQFNLGHAAGLEHFWNSTKGMAPRQAISHLQPEAEKFFHSADPHQDPTTKGMRLAALQVMGQHQERMQQAAPMAKAVMVEGGGKCSKTEVHYREGTPKKHCGKCEYYHDHRCEKVRGEICPDDLCDVYEARKGGSPAVSPIEKGKSMRAGGGGRFAKLKGELEGEGKSPESAGAIAAAIGRKKYGKKRFQRMAEHGRRRVEKAVLVTDADGNTYLEA